MKPFTPRRSTPACLTRWLMVCIGFLIPLPAARAQMEPVPFGQGTHAFRRILNDLDLTPLTSVEDLARQPENTLLIVLGEISILERMAFARDPKSPFLASFLRQGGAALVATDRWRYGWYWHGQEWFRVGAQLRLEAGSPLAFRSMHAHCIPVLPDRDQKPQLFPKQGHSVWTNCPAYFSQHPWDLPVLATLPPECRTANRLTAVPGPLDFALGGDWGNRGGRILVLADHSIFINDMMLQPDTGNIDFTYNCIQWLTDNGKRKQVLFIEENTLQKSFEVPVKEMPPPPLPPPEALVPIIDETIKNLEEENVFNQVAMNVLEDTLARQFGAWLGPVEALALLLTLSLLSFGMSRLMRARHRIEVGTPLLENALARLTPSEALVEQRRQAMLQSGNLWESARARARQCFESVLDISSAAGGRLLGRTPPAPRIRLLAGWWQSRRLQHQWDRLWQLAFGRTPTRVSPRQWEQLLREIDDVEAGLADGIIQVSGLRDQGSGTQG
jgi:hypothetical protein